MSERDIWFLDLEETIITDFTDPVVMNLEVVKEHFKKIGVKQVHIFSFAMWGEREKKIFNQPDFKQWLERVFDLEIVAAPTVTEVMDEIFWKTSVSWDLCEFISIFGKARAFSDYCFLAHPTKNCFLIDDVAKNEITINRDSNTSVELIQIDSLHQWKRFKNED